MKKDFPPGESTGPERGNSLVERLRNSPDYEQNMKLEAAESRADMKATHFLGFLFLTVLTVVFLITIGPHLFS